MEQYNIQFWINNIKNSLDSQKSPREVIFATTAAVVVFVDTVVVVVVAAVAVAQKVEHSGCMDYCSRHLLKIFKEFFIYLKVSTNQVYI